MLARLLAMMILGAGVAGGGAPAAARLPATGCWVNVTPTFHMRVCLAASGSHKITFSWDEPAGLNVPASFGSCRGALELNDRPGLAFAMTVPRQDGACRQDGSVEPLARREYQCLWQMPDDGGPAAPFLCEEAIYLDDGGLFSEVEGLRFERAE